MLNMLNLELEKIKNNELQNFVKQVLDVIPVDSWKLPSSRDHHLKDECEEWGNLIHTLRVMKVCDVMADIMECDQFKKDLLKSAAILHDCCKHGVNAEAAFIYNDHPLLVRKLIEKNGIESEYIEIILTIVEAHMGRWGPKNPQWMDDRKISLVYLLHVADCVEAHIDEILAINKFNNTFIK